MLEGAGGKDKPIQLADEDLWRAPQLVLLMHVGLYFAEVAVKFGGKGQRLNAKELLDALFKGLVEAFDLLLTGVVLHQGCR